VEDLCSEYTAVDAIYKEKIVLALKEDIESEK
jgi:hypothetical protein